MTQQHFIGFAILAAVFLAGVSSRPSNEELTPVTVEIDASDLESSDKEGKSLTYEVTPGAESNLKDILDKIKSVNDGLKFPKKRPQVNHNAAPQTGGGYVIDKDILDKIQQIIASGKLNPSSLTQKYQEGNSLNDDISGPRHSRDMAFGLTKLPINGNQDQTLTVNHNYMGLTQFPIGANNAQMPMAPIPYVTNMPVLVMPLTNNIYNNDLNSISADSSIGYMTRQTPSLPFNLPWPLAPFFPILIRDPLITLMGGGGFSNLFQYGQSADVCSRKQKSVEDQTEDNLTDNETDNALDEGSSLDMIINSRQGRALKKRTASSKSTLANDLENLQKVKKIFSTKPTTPKPIKQSYVQEQQDTKTASAFDDGDLRFSDWTLFGNRKPVAPSPGFFINRLKVRRGGVAIAGPGGVATAGRGGTAIVGPGGLAYTQPGGLAVAGPHARVVALSPDSDLTSIVSRLQDQSALDGSVPRLLEAIPEGRVVAHGPVIYYHPNVQTYYRGWGQNQGGYRRQGSGFSWRSDEYQHKGAGLGKNPWKKDSFWLVLKPVAHAISSPRGVAVANPISHVVISRNDIGTVIHTPAASAVAGPGGIAHAQSDLYLYDYYSESIDYLPFYGGAKGQYLEVKKDTDGTVTSEKIVSEDKISSENIIKYNNENLLAKVLAANLQSLKTTSNNLLRLHTLGRNKGFLDNSEKNRFKNQLKVLGEAASSTIKLIDEIGDDVDMLYRSNITRRKSDNYDDYIEEEGVGIDAPNAEDEIPLSGATIAEAKPVGLAVVGENGLAASRPMATAIASSGIALAQPMATAVAGVDPAALGLNLHIKHTKRN